MRSTRVILFVALALLPLSAARANERGQVIRAGDLLAEPFIDAAKVAPLASNQPVTVTGRRGGWLAVEVGGKRGWVRMLNVRLEAAARPAGSTAALRTGSTGRTVATGVKGLDEVDIRNAAIDRAQQAKLDSFGASDAAARQQAATNHLTEAEIAYLKPGKGK